MKKLLTVGAVLSVVYLVVFIRLPRLDYPASGYSVDCNNSAYGFGEVPGSEVTTSTNTGGTFYTFSPKWDVVAKVICGANRQVTQTDVQGLLNQYTANPLDKDVVTVANQKPNYGVVITRRVYIPSLAHELTLLGILAGLWLFGVVGWYSTRD